MKVERGMSRPPCGQSLLGTAGRELLWLPSFPPMILRAVEPTLLLALEDRKAFAFYRLAREPGVAGPPAEVQTEHVQRASQDSGLLEDGLHPVTSRCSAEPTANTCLLK